MHLSFLKLKTLFVLFRNIINIPCSRIRIKVSNKTLCTKFVLEHSLNINNNNNEAETTNIMDQFYVSPTVINLSNHKLSSSQCSLLSKGLKFCPTPGEPDQGHLWQDLHKFHRSLRRIAILEKSKIVGPEQNMLPDTPVKYFETENPISNTNLESEPFKNQKFKKPSNWNPVGPKDLEHFIARNELLFMQNKPRESNIHNLTLDEKRSIKELKNLNDIIIKPADKGAACVVMNVSDYKIEAYRQLSNENFYKKVPTDLTKKHHKEVDSLIQYIHYQGEISTETRNYLINDSVRTARFYMLPKIHKNKIPPPGRPIVSGNGCPTEKISAFVDFFLNPLSKMFPSYVKDTNHFLQKISKTKKIPNGAFLFSLDVESLYTSIKHNIGIRFTRIALEKLRPGVQKPSNENILLLLEAILTKNNFTFNNDHYLQIAGTAMGTKTAPSYANIVIAIFELLYVYTYPLQPLVWNRFIDDIFGIWPHGPQEFQKFVTHLNNCIDGLKFTFEISDKQISFLDTLVCLDKTGSLTTTLYRKPTDTYNYIRFDSAHPRSCKIGIPYGQFLRIRRICSNTSDYDRHANIMQDAFLQRGYPQDTVMQALIKARQANRMELLATPIENENTNRVKNVILVQTYNPGNNTLQNIVSKNWDLIHKHPRLKEFNNCNLLVANRRPKNLRDILTSSTFIEKHKKTIDKKCWNPAKCRYCPRISHQGTISSNINRRTYKTKTNVNCQTHNLVYCLECKKCGIQYVGETGKRILDRFQGHFFNISSSKPQTNNLIHDHYNDKNHSGLDNVIIHVLEFINVPSNLPRTKQIRLIVEQKWIHILKTVFHNGLNTKIHCNF